MKNILLILFLICSLLLKSQNKPYIECGPQYEKSFKNSGGAKFLGLVQDNYYFFKYESAFLAGEYFIEKYNSNMELISSQKIDFGGIELKSNLKPILDTNDFFLVDNKVVFFNNIWDRGNSKLTVNAHIIDENGKVGEDYKLIAETKTCGFGTEIKIVQSKDKSKLLYYQNPLILLSYERCDWGFKIFDSSLELLWEETHNLPYNDFLFKRISCEIDNDGNVYMGHIVVEDKQGLIYFRKHNLLIQKFKDKEYKLYTINPKDKTVTSYYYKKYEDIVKVVGFYSHNRVTSTSNGVFTLEIDIQKDKVINTATKEFDAKFLKENDEKAKGATNLFFNQIF